MKKSKEVFLIIDIIFLTFTVLFIWINSCLPVEDSSNGSENALGFFQGFFDFLFGEGVITHEVFRKLIHGAEFFLLGLELNLLLYLLTKYDLKGVAVILSISLFIAVIDESIQILSSRGPAVLDVLIDFGGAFAVTIIFLSIFYLVKYIKTKLNK